MTLAMRSMSAVEIAMGKNIKEDVRGEKKNDSFTGFRERKLKTNEWVSRSRVQTLKRKLQQRQFPH
jgi:hypothetical protein